MQVDDAVFHCQLKAVVSNGCAWADLSLVQGIAQEMLEILEYVQVRIPYAQIHLNMYR